MSAGRRSFVGRVRRLITRRRPDDDLDEELEDYLARIVERKVAAGENPKDAMRLARAELGSPAAIRDGVREVNRAAWFSTIWHDVRYGARLMRRSPGFMLVAALVLSFGIGVSTALFSIVNALFFTPVQVSAPGELVYISSRYSNNQPLKTTTNLRCSIACRRSWRACPRRTATQSRSWSSRG